jgi:hypothetical protein
MTEEEEDKAPWWEFSGEDEDGDPSWRMNLSADGMGKNGFPLSMLRTKPRANWAGARA